MMSQPVFWIALVSALLVYRDSRRRRRPHALAWAAAVLVFWIAALPAYIWRRNKT